MARADRAELKEWNGKLYIVTLKPVGVQVRYAVSTLYREITRRAPDTIRVSCYLALNERMTHGESATVTTSGTPGVCTEAIII